MHQLFQGHVCKSCGKLKTDESYLKDARGNSVYWADPKINQFTDVKVEFCGPMCSTKWHIDQIEAHRNATPDA